MYHAPSRGTSIGAASWQDTYECNVRSHPGDKFGHVRGRKRSAELRCGIVLAITLGKVNAPGFLARADAQSLALA
jgi:hypothetical protein